MLFWFNNGAGEISKAIWGRFSAGKIEVGLELSDINITSLWSLLDLYWKL